MLEKINPAREAFSQGGSLLDSQGPSSILSGTQTLVDQATGDFFAAATRPGTLLALTGGLAAGRLAQGGALSFGNPMAGALLSVCLRLGSKAAGLAAESAAFAGIERSLARLEGRPTPLKFTTEWGAAAASLGGLKLFSAFTRSQNLVMQHLAADLGLVGGRHLAHRLGLSDKPSGAFAEQMLDAEAMNWQMKASGVFLHGLFPSLYGIERSYDTLLRRPLRDVSLPSFPHFADFAEASAGERGPNRVAMAARKRVERGGGISNQPVRQEKAAPRESAILRANSKTDREFLAALLQIWQGKLPINYFQLFVQQRFGVILGTRIETREKPFDPDLEFRVSDGQVFLEHQKTPPPAPSGEALLRALWKEDRHPEAEKLKKVLRKSPWHLEDWIKVVETLRALKRYKESSLFLEQANRMNPVLASTMQRERAWAESKLRQVSHGPGPLRLSLFKERASELERSLDRYFESLRRLSDPPSDLPFHEHYDFPTNEVTYTKAFAEGERSIVGRGGVYVGTGASLFLPHMVHQGASRGYVVDYNRVVTEGIIPAVGALLIAAPNPIQWILRLHSISLTASEQAALARIPLRNIHRSPLFWRKGDSEMLHATVSDLLSLIIPRVHPDLRIPLTKDLISFFSVFMEFGDVRRNANTYLCFCDESGRGGILSSRKTFQKAQDLWREGRIVGVSARWEGEVFTKIARELNAGGEKVGVLYTSNILEHLSSEKQILDFVRSISKLPAEENTKLIHTQGGGFEFTLLTKREHQNLILGLEEGDGPIKMAAFLRTLQADPPRDARSYLRSTAPALLQDPLFQTLFPLLSRPPHSLSSEEAFKISRTLSPEDRWRFFFALKRQGILEEGS